MRIHTFIKRHFLIHNVLKHQALAHVTCVCVCICMKTEQIESSVTAKVGRHQFELYLGHVSMYKHHS